MQLSTAIESWNTPMIMDNMVEDWPAVQNWNPKYLAEKTSSLKLTFRLGLINRDSVQWETNSIKIEASIAEFNEWNSELRPLSTNNPFCNYSAKEFWAYADYKYVAETLKDFPDLVKELCWSDLGFPVNSSWKSTLWMGSQHAYSICHYDTYAYNLVVQLHGTKRWILFPPYDTENLYPTRIPLEESTVFSRVNLIQPNMKVTPKFAQATPHVVTLKPGQVLFVPRHWWHFVTCESGEAAISVNLWIDQPHLDNSQRLSEALTRLVTFSLIDNDDSSLSSMTTYLHDKEQQELLEDNWFSKAMENVKQACTLSASTTENSSPLHCRKFAKLDNTSSQSLLEAKAVPPSKLTDVFDLAEHTAFSGEENSDLSSEDVVRAFTHPSVIELVKQILINK